MHELSFFFTFHNVSINTAQQHQARFTTHVFTFHNVSINTEHLQKMPPALFALHSTMFLLIRKKHCIPWVYIPALHSTMFLLIHTRERKSGAWTGFTFHNVSINTESIFLINRLVICFTFHNVSINTCSIRNGRKVFPLYIPQCFY